MVAAAVGVGLAATAASVGGSIAQGNAAGRAARAQTRAAQAGIDTQDEGLDKIMGFLQPYADAGASGLDSLKNLLGLNGTNSQQSALDALQQSPQLTSVLKQGENAILQNASATGGLRGGNTQDALSRYAGDAFSRLIDSQFQKLAGVTNLGYSAATNQANAVQANANNVTGLLTQQGQAQAGQALASGNAVAGSLNGISNGIGAAFGAYGAFPTGGSGFGAGAPGSLFGGNAAGVTIPQRLF